MYYQSMQAFTTSGNVTIIIHKSKQKSYSPVECLAQPEGRDCYVDSFPIRWELKQIMELLKSIKSRSSKNVKNNSIMLYIKNTKGIYTLYYTYLNIYNSTCMCSF